jgi:hypothetical protein
MDVQHEGSIRRQLHECDLRLHAERLLAETGMESAKVRLDKERGTYIAIGTPDAIRKMIEEG